MRCAPFSAAGLSRTHARRPHVGSVPRPSRCAASADSGGFFDGLKKLGKSVQGGLPVVGLLSRLTSPEGGFDELSYPEYCRSKLEAGSDRLNFAIEVIENKYKRQASRRPLFLLTWMIRKALGALPGKHFILTARRLNASMDLEAEMGRFESLFEEECRKYSILELPLAPPIDQVPVAVDAVSTCCFGLRDRQPVEEADQAPLLDILAVLFPEVDEQVIKDAIASKPERQYA